MIYYHTYRVSLGKTANNIAVKIISFIESLGSSPYVGKRLLHLSQYGELDAFL